MMNNRKKFPTLQTLGMIGALTFLLINWWPLFSGDAADPALQFTPSITQIQAQQTALTFTSSLCSNCVLESFIVYQSNEELSGYLQKNHLVETYIHSLATEVPVDYFQVELVDKISGNHYFVDVHPDNKKVIGWQILNSGLDPKQQGEEQGKFYYMDEQIQIAYALMKEMGYEPNLFYLKEETSLKVVPDNNYTKQLVFTHKYKSIGEAFLQLHISIRGGEIISFRPVFPIPKDHQLWQQKQDDSAAFMSRISLIMSIVMMVAALVFVIRYRKTVSYSTGIVLSIMFAIIYSINNINLYPGFRASSGISEQNGFYGLIYIFLMQLIIILITVSVYFSYAAGVEMWKRQGWNFYPRWRQESFGLDLRQGMGRGYLLCLVLLGAQSVLFLIAEKHFDMWATNDPATSPYNMFWPILFPLLAWAAAISEEAIYRVFGIILFKNLFRNTFLAVLIPSMIWALGHTQYSVFPVYTRFIEVTLLGIIFGYAFLKYGFLTVLFAHAIMDSILMAFSLMSLGGVANVLIGLFYIAFPALIASLFSRLHKRSVRSYKDDSSSRREDIIT